MNDEQSRQLQAELTKLKQTMANLRELLSGEALATALAPLLTRQAELQAILTGSGAVAQGEGAQAVGESGVLVDGSVGGSIVIAKEGARVYIGEAPVAMPAVDRESALGRYLQHLISRNRYLQLQGIRSGGRLVNIELDQIYVTLRATRQRIQEADWLAEEANLAPGEMRRRDERRGGEDADFISPSRAVASSPHLETVTVSVNEALAASRRLAVLGDPGSGKTTLLRYLALLYARDLAEHGTLVPDKLGLAESGWLPILLPLRQIGTFLRTRPDDGTEGHALLLEFLLQSLKNERIQLPDDFFDEWLTQGRAAILLDGLDEVADPDLRRRVSRLVEAFTQAYADCRYVVTSRIVGYTGPARLGEEYATTTVRDFTLADVERFLSNWHRLVAIGQMGPGQSAEAYAAEQTRQLLQAIEANERVRELAINPLLLTVIAMVHRDRVKLPDRRAELYAEAVDVLLGKWEEAKGVTEVAILDNKPFDVGDKRLMLQRLALHMHEQRHKEIAGDDLRRWLDERFYEIVGNRGEVTRVVSRFLNVIEERTGLLAARGEGVYAFSHLTFQEYLAALAVAARDDYVAYTLKCGTEPWWREVILLAAGYLSTQSRERTTRLIQAIADFKEEPEPYHNLVLAAECLRDVGSNRVQGDLLDEVQQRLRKELETPLPKGWLGSVQSFVSRGMRTKVLAERRSAAAVALARIGGESYWSQPYGEPEWINIPAGPFWMGEGSEEHQVEVAAYAIARVPVTNAQYQLFVQATSYGTPRHWEEGRPPKGEESHPVVAVSWNDALAYCEWLSRMTGKKITLPSEAEWEKAARGDKDRRVYPWGGTFDPTRCNSYELGLNDTTPAGIFPNGASPYGCLDMAGNVWEWTRSLYQNYPYDPRDGREDLEAGGGRVLRGGSFYNSQNDVRCAFRYGSSPDARDDDISDFEWWCTPFCSWVSGFWFSGIL
jgi:formylglycine-generating enzyme required for sulfatase activity